MKVKLNSHISEAGFSFLKASNLRRCTYESVSTNAHLAKDFLIDPWFSIVRIFLENQMHVIQGIGVEFLNWNQNRQKMTF